MFINDYERTLMGCKDKGGREQKKPKKPKDKK